VKNKALAAALVFVLGASSGACGEEEAATAPPAAIPPPAECAAGFVGDPRGFCLEQVTTETCPAGSRPKIGSTKCEPVGWTTSCPAGLDEDPSGWGCVDARVPKCEGPTRESQGTGKCVAVGDCNAAFPPAGAIVVDDSFTDAQVDATHFKTIAAAIAAAAAGSIVAVESGTYAEELKIDKTLQLVGRCAAEVKITPGALGTTDPGILVENKASGVVIKGVTVDGPHIGGIDVYFGADALIEEVVVEGSKLWGVIVDASTATIKRSKISGTLLGPDPQGKETKGGWDIAAGASTVSIDDVDLAGGTSGIFSGTSDTQISGSRVVIRNQAPQAPVRAAGAYARAGRILLERAVIHDLVADGALSADQPRTIVEARDIVIRDVKVANGARGYGAVAYGGGEIEIHNASIIGAESLGLLARDSGSILTAVDTVVRGPAKSYAVPDEDLIVSSERSGIGIEVLDKARMNLEGVAIIETFGWAAYADSGGVLDLKHVLIDGTKPLQPKRDPLLPFAVGISVSGAKATIEDVTVLHSLLAGVGAGKNGEITGSGLFVRDVVATDPVGTGAGVATGDGAKIDLEASAIVDSMSAGILAMHGNEASVRFANGTVHGTRLAPQGFGLASSSREAARPCSSARRSSTTRRSAWQHPAAARVSSLRSLPTTPSPCTCNKARSSSRRRMTASSARTRSACRPTASSSRTERRSATARFRCRATSCPDLIDSFCECGAPFE
jgi:hypothetical protein